MENKQTFLQKKIQYEYESFLMDLKMCRKDTIIDKSQEIEEKKQIVHVLSNVELEMNNRESNLLNAQENLLEQIYQYLKRNQEAPDLEHIVGGIRSLQREKISQIMQKYYGVTEEPGMTEETDFEGESEAICLPLTIL